MDRAEQDIKDQFAVTAKPRHRLAMDVNIGLDPIHALAALVQAIAELTRAVAESQTPEQRKQMWDWYIEDVTRWRKLFKIDEP